MAREFAVPEEFSNRTLSEVVQEGGGGRADVLASFLGIDPNRTLQAGEIFSVGNIPGVDPAGSAEFQFLQRSFRPGGEVRQEQRQAQQDQALQRAMEFQRQAIQPAVETFKGQKPELKERYDKIIEHIRGREEKTIQESDVATARKFAQRGILPSSSFVATQQGEARQDIREDFSGLELQAEGNLQDRLFAIDQAIATLQTGATKDAVSQALNQARLALEGESLDLRRELGTEELDLSRQQLAQSKDLSEQELALRRQQLQQPDTTIQTIGGRVKMIAVDPGTGQPISTVDLGSATSGKGGLSASEKQNVAQQVLDVASEGVFHDDLQKQFGAKLGTDKVTELYNAVSPYGPHKTGDDESIKTSAAYQSYKSAGFTDEEIKEMVQQGLITL